MSKYIDSEKLKRHYSWWEDGTKEMTLHEAKMDFDIIVDLQPAADVVEVRHGQWLAYAEDFDGFARCSVCGKGETMFGEQWLYCPNCGSRMDAE